MMTKSRAQIEAEGRELFTERMLSQTSPQTKEERERAIKIQKKLDKKLKEHLIKQGYDPKEFGL